MSSTTNDDGKRRIVAEDEYGSRHVRLGDVEGAAVSVETPDIYSDEQIGVSGFAYDDAEGQVQLTFGSEVRVGVTLSPGDARQLGQRVFAAAEEADTEIDGES